MTQGIATEHRPNLKRLELHITYRCNLRCTHCSNLITVAPSNECMSLAAIQRVLDDSVRLQWFWEWLVLHGGEPTLHPRFAEICALLGAFKRERSRYTEIVLCTNGCGDKVAAGIAVAESHGFKIENSKKTGTREVWYHIPLYSSAQDRGEDYRLGCFQTSRCGIALTERGFYECSPAASMYRVFGYEPLARTLDELTEERLAAGFALHCRHCGYAALAQRQQPGAPLSPVWEQAAQAYAQYSHD